MSVFLLVSYLCQVTVKPMDKGIDVQVRGVTNSCWVQGGGRLEEWEIVWRLFRRMGLNSPR